MEAVFTFLYQGLLSLLFSGLGLAVAGIGFAIFLAATELGRKIATTSGMAILVVLWLALILVSLVPGLIFCLVYMLGIKLIYTIVSDVVQTGQISIFYSITALLLLIYIFLYGWINKKAAEKVDSNFALVTLILFVIVLGVTGYLVFSSDIISDWAMLQLEGIREYIANARVVF